MATGSADYLGAIKPAYYKQNPLTRAISCNTPYGAATGGPTVRATYTVPAARQAYMEFIDLIVLNLAAAATNSDASIQCLLTTITDGSQVVAVAWIGTAQAKDSCAIGGAGLLNATEVVQLRDFSNNSGAGSNVTTRGAVKLTEFDA